jgi:uncharacterized damage-inducible protein DinB
MNANAFRHLYACRFAENHKPADQVVHHATDHRAQWLRLLSDLGIQTASQDYVFYLYEHPAQD